MAAISGSASARAAARRASRSARCTTSSGRHSPHQGAQLVGVGTRRGVEAEAVPLEEEGHARGVKPVQGRLHVHASPTSRVLSVCPLRVVLARTVTYLENNQKRMDYPRYRQQGLPITSCAVESLIKE